MANLTHMTPTQEIQYLQSLIRQVLNDLPGRRDWLDPQVEKAMRTAAPSVSRITDVRITS